MKKYQKFILVVIISSITIEWVTVFYSGVFEHSLVTDNLMFYMPSLALVLLCILIASEIFQKSI